MDECAAAVEKDVCGLQLGLETTLVMTDILTDCKNVILRVTVGDE